MKIIIILVACVIVFVAGLIWWTFSSQSGKSSEGRTPPPVKSAAPVVITENNSVAKMPDRTEEPEFVPAAGFEPRGGRGTRTWTPLGDGLKFWPDAQEGLQLTSTEFQALKEAISFLLTKAGEIQGEDAYVANDAEGRAVVFLEGIPAKWTGIESAFNKMLETAIGGAKSRYLLKSNGRELGMVTGKFGNEGRAMVFQRADVTPGDMAGWRVSIIAGLEVEQTIGRFFAPDVQEKIRRASRGKGAGWELTVDFVEPPPFIKPLLDDSEVK